MFSDKFLVVFAIFAAFFSFSAARYSDCGSEVGKIETLEISNCEDSAKKCILKRNTNATLHLTFTPSTDIDSITAVVHGVILGVPMPFDLPNPDGCHDSGLKCPLEAGKTYTYVASLPVSQNYPKVTVDVKWELQDKEDKDIVCALIPSKVN